MISSDSPSKNKNSVTAPKPLITPLHKKPHEENTNPKKNTDDFKQMSKSFIVPKTTQMVEVDNE